MEGPSYGEAPDFLHGVVADSAFFAGAFVNKKMIGMGRAFYEMIFFADPIIITQKIYQVYGGL